MPRFEVLSGSNLIGWSDLELGDPPMGVAFGRFFPSPAYSIGMALPQDEISQSSLSLRISGGETLRSSAGVQITDYSADLGPDGIEVSIFGITYPSYESLFPEHVASYERQFPSGG